MPQDITVAVSIDHREYQARLLNTGAVQIYLEGALVGGGEWDGERIAVRDNTLATAVYRAVEAMLAQELERPLET